jgi:FkbH-like protein
MKNFSDLKKNLKKDFSGLEAIKVAVLGDTATQFLVQAIRATGFDWGYDLQIREADFNQVERQVFDPGSELYEFSPDIIILFQSSHKLLGKYNKMKPEEYASLADKRLHEVKEIHATLHERLGAKIIYYNYAEINDAVFGNYAGNLESSFLFQLRKLNYRLMEFAAGALDFYLADLSSIQNEVGKPAFFHSAIYINTEMVLSIDVLPLVAKRTLDLIGAMYGKFKKCVIIDLDNTTWGGIIGDDGIENIQLGSLGIGKVFTEFQYWLKKLKNRGIILAICSKNTESVARAPFERHPDMVLHLDDISVFIANWENKADNIRQIQSILNIGFDSMVFLDDNPFERNIVRENIPGITVPELPEDPAEYLEYLYSLNLFETVSFSQEDRDRTKQYQVEAERHQLLQKSINEEEFLQSLDMVSQVGPFNKFNTPRVAQLSQRSNQLNLRTVRYSESDIERLSHSQEHFTFSFTLTDKFGDNGLICVTILQKESEETLFIDSWFMSCRVLKRGMEQFVLNTMARVAREKGFRYLRGEYLPTEKNAMVKDHYQGLGFESAGDGWLLDVVNYKPQTAYILTFS